MSECVYCRQGSIAIGVDGPVCPDCWEEGYGHSPRTADLRTPIKAMTDEELLKRLVDWSEHDEGKINDARHEAKLRIEALTAKLAKAVEGLRAVDALDPEGMIDGCSHSALRGLVLRMGEISRATLAEIKGDKP